MKKQDYPTINDEESSMANESAVDLTETEVLTAPPCTGYAHIVNGTLQITPDIEEEIVEAEHGETVSMNEFKSMFAQWL